MKKYFFADTVVTLLPTRLIVCARKGFTLKPPLSGRHHPHHSALRDYISDTTRSFRRVHAWRLTRFISR